VIIVAVVNLKGGSTKTTSAAYLLHAFHEAGQRVIGVDADGQNESLHDWQSDADWPFPVVGMAVPNLHKQLPGVLGEGRYDVVVIDTPPMREQRGTVLSAVRLATHVLVPMAPTPMEHKELPKVRSLLDEAEAVRPAGAPATAVLFTRCAPRAASTTVYRELVSADGWTVLAAQVGRREVFAQAYGDPIMHAGKTPYGDAAAELLEMTP
jgi:chromosome partitioning protein